MSWWLEGETGWRRRIDAGGLSLGRRESCEVVLEDPRASTLQTLLLPGPEGLELRSIGRNATSVNGSPVARARLAEGDVIEVPGARFTVRRGRQAAAGWVVHTSVGRFGLSGGAVVLGGGEAVDLQLPGLRGRVAALRVVSASVLLEALAPVEVRGEAVDIGGVEELLPGDEVRVGGQVFTLQAVRGQAAPTVGGTALPVRAEFSFLATGGRLVLAFADGRECAVELSELRARLVALLLKPPGGLEAGELVPDEDLLPRIWPGQPRRGRLDLNTLVHRTRKDLLEAGVNPAPVLVRPRAGGSVALRVARGAVVTVS